MSKQRGSARGWVLVGAVFCAALLGFSFAAHAQPPAVAPAPQPAVVNEEAAAGQPKAAAAEIPIAPLVLPGSSTPLESKHTIKLRVDGNLAGRVTVLDSTGQHRPVRVRVALLRNRQVVGSARSDEMGYFQVPNVSPGVYSVVALGRDGFGAVGVRVLPFDRGVAMDPARPFDGAAAAELPFISNTVNPHSEYQHAQAKIAEEVPELFGPPVGMFPPGAPVAPEAGVVGGGGGGGGGMVPPFGFGGGGGGGGGGFPPASPSKP